MFSLAETFCEVHLHNYERRIFMRKIVLIVFTIAFISPSIANAHGGGCRKDSLPGQCCHAGSEPYHCH